MKSRIIELDSTSPEYRSELIRELALEEGFLLVGFAAAEEMKPESERLKEWLGLSYHGKMSYMENHFEKRTDPGKLHPGTMSVISLAYNYHTEIKQEDPEAPKISSYAYGRDYHKVVKKKLKTLAGKIESRLGSYSWRAFVDSAPVLERDWAKRAGIGWIGKNTMLINPRKGSRFFLAELLVDLELSYDKPMDDYCGTCTRCIDACPTDAILEEAYKMDASRCISYLTIELKDEEIPPEFAPHMENWMFGCDICQDVCPWNRFSEVHNEDEFIPSEKLIKMTQKEWANLSQEEFNELFKASAVKRTGYSGLKRNIKFLNKQD